MRQHLLDPLRFFAAFVANPRQVGAVLPTSRSAVRDMLDLADVPAADLVVELGAGTGVQTGEILARLRPDARLVAVEIDQKLATALAKRYAGDDRLQVLADSAENVAAHLDGRRADVLVSALPFTSLGRRAAAADPRRAAPSAGPAGRDGGDPVLAADAG
ncbi:class I SAM-dependent methyltransferase [Blastococcus sp. TML/C7B]|uniref:class I SAM-dependent methyltransferase n=1 Tax=Blastococcus sp. TML/C7B TaxID=2798728 RepID=UPI001F5B419F|nr:rRNA adenine N-6-methyltransferase family protein [Blastococcus sp. TML/C7B]